MLMRVGVIGRRASMPAFVAERRREPREAGPEGAAALLFRGAEYQVPVIDISARGARIACDLPARIGETVMIRFDACSAIRAFVRWRKDGAIGLNFGPELVLG